MLDLTGHMIIWGGLFTHGDGSTGLMKVGFCYSGSIWPSVVIHEHWPVSQLIIVEMGDYAWSEHIVTVFLVCQITIKNVQVQLTVKGKTTPDSYTPPPEAVVPKMWLS
jgi:hypothetical protein